MNGTNDRRKKLRYALSCSVLFFRQSADPIAEGITRNLSSAGFYCLSPTPLEIGESLTCLLKMPPHDAVNKESLTLQCRVRVVRIDGANEEGAFGIACQIDGYHTCLEERPRAKVQGA